MTSRKAKTTVWILGDQLTPRISSLEGLQPSGCVILMIESIEHGRRLLFHKQKLVLVWSAMRHFAEKLRQLGYEVDYYQAASSFAGALRKHINRHKPRRLRVMESAEFGLTEGLIQQALKSRLSVETTPNTMFLSDKEAFQRESMGKHSRIMEAFYRKMRKRTGILMTKGKPIGGTWNYDEQNRKRPPKDLRCPPIPTYTCDAITCEVISLVEKNFSDHFGRADTFRWPVTRKDAQRFLDDFLEHRLAQFGPFQDAMVLGQRALFHSLLSPLLNLGLLEPLELCRRAEAVYHDGKAPLNSVEGFIRQVLGWREYVYQVYHWRMPDYDGMNYLETELPLPEFYWNGNTRMRCMREAIEALIEDGINHHIQRLMITGNFALIAGLNPQQVNEWYWLAYVDAHEWVVTPNVLGMALYADGGILGTKPYAASANYINRMSDYCRGCPYNPRAVTGEEACPFNALYWDFLVRNENKLRNNPRMALTYRNLDKRKGEDLRPIQTQARRLLRRLRNGEVI
ncbi:MAG: cryptochrome/photolyase family protein [Candidatus Hydrogenedentota bacterium]